MRFGMPTAIAHASRTTRKIHENGVCMNQALLEEAAAAVKRRLKGASPQDALVLGSGWGDVADCFDAVDVLPYSEIPTLGGTRVVGHAGRLVLASCEGRQLLIFQGRRHWYEGVGWEPVALPVFLCVRFGVSRVLFTNAAGGVRENLQPGDLMVIDDHVNAIGSNPLAGPHDSIWGPRFPDMSEVYDRELRAALDAAAAAVGQALAHGVYLATTGPVYETPAEIRAYAAMGADAVGMSTVPEATLAHAAGLRVAGLSCITNLAAGVSPTPLSHDEVIAETGRAQHRMQALLPRFFSALASADDSKSP